MTSLALGAVLLCATVARAATWYVDNSSGSCSNSGAGTEAQPYCTISAAVAAHQGAGTIILVKPGIYREQVTIPASGASGTPFVIQATGPGVIVDGSDDFSSPSAWTLSSGTVYQAAGVTWSPKQVFADGARLAISTAAPASLPVNSFVYVAGSGLYVNLGGDNPGTHALQVGHRTYGFYVSSKSWVTIDGFTVRRAEDRNVQLNTCTNVTITRSALSFSAKFGMQISGGSADVVDNVTSSDNADHGLSMTSGATGCTIQDSEFFRNVNPAVRAANGIYMFGAPSNLVRRCRFHDNQDTGLHMQSGSNNNTSILNRSWNNGDHGYDHLTATGIVHVGDVAYANYKDGFSYEGGASGCQMFDCLATDNGIAVKPADGNLEYDLWVDQQSSVGFVSDYNLFWNSTSAEPVKYITTLYASVAAYSAASGQDAHSLQANPRFVLPAAGDFHLQAGSPAIDSGNSGVANWPGADAAGQAPLDDPATANTGTGPVAYLDRGAFEFVPLAVDHAPAVAAPVTASGAENTPLSFGVTASDPDGQAISSLTATGLPAGASFVAGAGNTSGTFTWTPGFTQAGTYVVTFTAANTLSGSASTTITISNTDRAPSVSAPATASVAASALLTIGVTASDPDGEAITSLTAAGLPSGASFVAGAGNTTGTLTWTPTASQTGTYAVTFTAANARSGSATTVVTVTGTTNRPPVAALSASPATGNAPLAVTLNAAGSSDPDGTIASYNFDFGDGVTTGAQAGASASHTYAGGTWTARVTVTDNLGATAQATATVTVAAVVGGPNRVTNPSFEANTAGWVQYSGATLARVAGGFDGGWSLQVTGIGGSPFGADDSPNSVTSTSAAGQKFRLSAWVRSVSGTGSIRIRVREYLGLTRLATVNSASKTLSSTWQLLTVDYTASRAGTALDFNVIDTPGASNAVILVDNVSIRDVTGLAVAAEAGIADASDLEEAAPLTPFQARMAPSPVRDGAALAFRIARSGPVRVGLFDLDGRRVRQLLDERDAQPGIRRVSFDGRDDQGVRLSSGVYFFRIQAAGETTSGRFVIAR